LIISNGKRFEVHVVQVFVIFIDGDAAIHAVNPYVRTGRKKTLYVLMMMFAFSPQVVPVKRFSRFSLLVAFVAIFCRYGRQVSWWSSISPR